MTAGEKMIKQVIAASFEHILEVGEEAVLNEIKELGEDLRIYPNLLKRLEQSGFSA